MFNWRQSRHDGLCYRIRPTMSSSALSIRLHMSIGLCRVLAFAQELINAANDPADGSIYTEVLCDRSLALQAMTLRPSTYQPWGIENGPTDGKKIPQAAAYRAGRNASPRR